MEEQTGLNLDKEAVQSRYDQQKDLGQESVRGLFLKDYHQKDYTADKEDVFHQSYVKVDYTAEKQGLFNTVYEYPTQNDNLNKNIIAYTLVIIIAVQMIFIIFKIITRRKAKS